MRLPRFLQNWTVDWGEIDWPAVRAWCWKQTRRLLLLSGIVLFLTIVLFGARWSCAMNPWCPWAYFC